LFLILIAILLVAALFFGGFRKETQSSPAPHPVPVSAGRAP
jgi:hypothetical protein